MIHTAMDLTTQVCVICCYSHFISNKFEVNNVIHVAYFLPTSFFLNLFFLTPVQVERREREREERMTISQHFYAIWLSLPQTCSRHTML